ncbi:MAG: YifB family Mg chelatase-like AAA ATPase [Candidatus Palauibacterales bacterium]|nr:YifB family Mg chelatase-like AAA ATPase [Candidatus Palauibacterales bacterium]MDP2530169.1 YifB family Mg chelatase-like AAA ATPase [Candidatus Palauibacterales bacterium]
MLATIPSAALVGLEVVRVRVEVAITRGTPMIQVVGLPESAVREGRERIRAAAGQVGLHVPGLRITVNLAPAALRKHGAAFDLPILVGILAAWGELPAQRCAGWLVAGELGLDGSLRPVCGALPMALHARRSGDLDGIVLPLENLAEVRPVDARWEATEGRPLRVHGAADLEQVLAFLRGDADLPRARDAEAAAGGSRGDGESPGPDLAEVRGQRHARRVLEVAAAGGHSLLLRGEPGAGKTLLARCLPSLLPPLSLEEAVEVTAIHSVAGRLPRGAGLIEDRPFRAPHHTVSPAGLLGGGSSPRPGELSLAHRGVLFLDELPEFSRPALEGLRQPLEDGRVRLVRARAAVSFPARVQLVAAMNPCPCGRMGSSDGACTCDPAAARRYARRVSGPLLDRIDLQVDVPRVPWRDLSRDGAAESSERVRARVTAARSRAARRTGGRSRSNAQLADAELDDVCRLDLRGKEALGRRADMLRLSARACRRVLRVARTVADLDGADRIAAEHVLEAVRYRSLDRVEEV